MHGIQAVEKAVIAYCVALDEDLDTLLQSDEWHDRVIRYVCVHVVFRCVCVCVCVCVFACSCLCHSPMFLYTRICIALVVSG